jgi:hypothetical protein
MYNPLYPPMSLTFYSPLYPPFYSRLYSYLFLRSPLYSPYKNNLQDYIRKIENDLKQKSNPLIIDNVDNNYGILPIIGFVLFFFTFGKNKYNIM